MLKYFEIILLISFICYLFYDESRKEQVVTKPIHSFIILNNGDTAWVKIEKRSIVDTTYTLKKPE